MRGGDRVRYEVRVRGGDMDSLTRVAKREIVRHVHQKGSYRFCYKQMF